jgi:hypothetical protein
MIENKLKDMSILVIVLLFIGCVQTTKRNEDVNFESVTVNYRPLQGIGPEDGIVRRDPSDIIKVDGVYYVWYTKVVESAPGYPEGYNGTIWYAASKDGIRWEEKSEALGRGDADKFDAFGVFTPNIIYAPTTGKYYLYYTGVRTDNSEQWDFKKFSGSIGVAEADSPTGGVEGWQRTNKGKPVLSPRIGVKGVFDGWHTDDVVVFYRDKKYWLYYKGHSQYEQLLGTGLPNGATPMGLVVSDRPDRGFERVPLSKRQQFLIQPGHELLLWAYGNGILSFPTGHYRPKHPDDFCLHYSIDGVNFSVVSPVVSSAKLSPHGGLMAPGLYRPELTDPNQTCSGQLWGISMTTYGRKAGLQLFTLKY